MGGEKYDCTGQEFTNWGSPPRRRGKGHGQSLRRGLKRITPAWAGKRRPTLRASPRAWDHPRVGGEKFHSAAEIDEKMGSPPHRRGKVIVNLILTKGHRITPAQAGKGQE